MDLRLERGLTFEQLAKATELSKVALAPTMPKTLNHQLVQHRSTGEVL